MRPTKLFRVLETVDLKRSLSRAEYKERMGPLRERLRSLQYALKDAELATIVLFEGWDASGKSSMVRRLAERLDPRAFRAWPGSPPSELEQRYHWLWRYQLRTPEDGHLALFDHSWYGRVLVERVEKVVKKKVWQRSYEQINEFERWLTDDGQVLVKFWLHISRKEQRRRLAKMEADAFERWKVSAEDWRRNRRYDQWTEAVEAMLAKTDTPHAPWTLVEAEDVRWARVRVLETLVRAIEAALKRRQEAPAAVSRSQLAQKTTKAERDRRAKEDLQRVRETAKDAGLPLESGESS
jgi:polyphosphate kinase 2 (PPK2 family)